MRQRMLLGAACALVLAGAILAAHAQQDTTKDRGATTAPSPNGLLVIQPLVGAAQNNAQDNDMDEDGDETTGQGGHGMMGGMMGQQGMMGAHGGMMGGGRMGARTSVIMRVMFALMDTDGDGTVELPEFQAAHERIFKAMDANKDGKLTFEEMQAFLRGRPATPPQ